jgi:hypothetical protein
VALAGLTMFNVYMQQAEMKATTLATIHLGTAALAATQAAGPAAMWQAGGPRAVLAAALLAGFLAGFAVGGWHLAAAMRPNLTGPSGANRFGLVRNPGNGVPPRADAGEQEKEVWLLVQALRDVAVRKHRRIRRALPWTALAMASTVGWLAGGAIAG